MSEIYTSSRLRVLRECLRKHFYRYVLRIRGPETDQMRFGNVGHKALEAWFRAWKAGEDRLAAAISVVDASELSPFDMAKLRVLICAYHARWSSEDWEIIDVEIEFRYTLGAYLIGGKIDAIIRQRKDGRIFIVEHKTTGMDASLGSAYWERISIDTQVSIYVDGATILGHEIAGCVYDVLKRPGHEQKLATPVADREYTAGKGCKKCGGSAKAGEVVKGNGYYTVNFTQVEHIKCDGCDGTGWKLDKDGTPEAPRLYARFREVDETLEEYEARVLEEISSRPDDYLVRGIVVRLDDELPRMRLDLIDTIEIERTGLAPRNPEACSSFGRLCEFFDACSGRASIEDQFRFPRGAAHPELANAA